MKHFFYLFLLIILSTPLDARNSFPKEYHVATTGKDANEGSLEKPFKTIMAAASAAMPGDVVTVHTGTYREQINPPRGGNSDTERITYQAAKGEKVVIKGSEVIKGWVRLDKDTWQVRIANSLFGKFNPYREVIKGDWFSPRNRVHHRGAVYLNDDWLMEAPKKADVLQPADAKNLLWYAEAGEDSTTIWAQFKNADPNNELVEINVRPTVFYPDRPFINYLTVKGFILEQAATNWAPPTAEQEGLIGTHWSKGWIIENNTVRFSKCVGIALGKYGDAFDNKNTESAKGYVGTIERALANGWNKSTVGSHLVSNNVISDCEQAGIVGSMGCSFSIVRHNYIHHIQSHRLFGGAEMAGIKFHAAVDVLIEQNHIHHANLGIWLDWMAQGAQVNSNVLHDNDRDMFLEVDHGPLLVSNNLFLSGQSVSVNAQGIAFVHNLFAGKFSVAHYDNRLTPFMKAHSTYVSGLCDNPCGDIRFYNNLFVEGSDVSQYAIAILPVVFEGNVYTKGSLSVNDNAKAKKWFGEMDEASRREMNKKYHEQSATQNREVAAKDFDVRLARESTGDGLALTLNLDKSWLDHQRATVTSQLLGTAALSGQPFENPDHTPVTVTTDYFGKPRKNARPSPGPFEIKKSGPVRIKVW